ncbi:MAG: TIGR01212 family radical SAM protein [Aliifodinibius sp.]|nr:TIGR01212 family radical SAM protein [candidate division Zixibacteria bacterium]NIT61137.1 TIGR01212 family radical SAM protein [Fodinibius sp.]NIS48593.1 TIGR01212 family radical SAM protein [candidate division Zixibacteria bacterium]NIU13128.1 TIGR01212 family radical SAM protein [candidate division Zixibacteria bacterium]NIV08832.1 TIGR01212 family radical SAM protein [candidate division Zixibacteria bacterium]
MIDYDQKATSVKTQVFPWESTLPYNAYKDYLKQRFGGRIQKVSVDAGFTCPNRDGSKAYGGCTYCNNLSFVPPYCEPVMSIAEQVEAGVNFVGRRYKVNQFMVYFQAYSNTYAPLSYLKGLYEQALAHPQVMGLAIGTRPDCVDEEKIAYLEELARDYFISIEYGVESIYDKTLERLNRGHTFQEWAEAVEMTAGRGIHICTHVILGLPGESKEEMLHTAEVLSRYPIGSIKLHHLHIVKKTQLAAEYKKNPFPVLGYAEYLDLVVEFLQRLRPDIRIQRLVGETHPRHLLAPLWNVGASTVQQDIVKRMKDRDAWQGKLYRP